ncbi:MAG: hypothetical protein WC624_03880 [Candidatus Margulisiibacteriota bacterium]
MVSSIARLTLGAALAITPACAGNVQKTESVPSCVPAKPPVLLYTSSGKPCDTLFETNNYVSFLDKDASVCGVELSAGTGISRLIMPEIKVDSHLMVWAAFPKNDIEIGGLWYKGGNGIAFVDGLVLNGILAKPAKLAGPDGIKHYFFPGDAINFGVYKPDSWETSSKFSTYLISAITRERVNF